MPPADRRTVNIPCLVPTCVNTIVDDAQVCAGCASRLTSALRSVHDGPEGPGLASDLEVSLSRRHRTGPGNMGRRSTEAPLPYDARSAEALAVLRNTLTTWCRLLHEEIGGRLPEDTPSAMAAWLSRFTDWLRRSDFGAECVDEIIAAVEQAERAIDLPEKRVLAGLCPGCGLPCYARHDASRARCGSCETELSVREGRERLFRTAEGHLLTAAEAARALGLLGHEVTAAAIRGLARRGRLHPGGTGSAGRPLYTLGDVLEACLDSEDAA